MKAKIIIALLLCIGSVGIGAQSQVPEQLAAGLRAFQDGELTTALEHFEGATTRTDPSWRGHAYFWTARTRMALGRYENAADAFDLFLSDYPGHPYEEESTYQRARLFLLQDQHEAAIQHFAGFLDRYPDSDFRANALFWTGEALFALGRLDEAERLFAEVTERYPSSFRVEAARYRLDIVDLARREDELLTLLQWSHEEYLAALATFQARERSYQEALRSYRNRLAGLATEDFRQEIRALNDRIGELESTVTERETRINELLALLRQAGQDGVETGAAPPVARRADATPSGTGLDLELRESLLSLKAQALELQQILLGQSEDEE